LLHFFRLFPHEKHVAVAHNFVTVHKKQVERH
jgi:hypothetical protein